MRCAMRRVVVRCSLFVLRPTRPPRRSTKNEERRTKNPARIASILLLALLTLGQARNPDLERIRGEIARLRQRLDVVRTQQKSAQQQVEEADLELLIRTRELALAVDMQTRLEQEQRGVEEQIAALGPR